ncbi:unnamed protein product [Fraxinus pennsylvanica]|uniref:AMP-dependent synthetase/ligase domain-containing protein n=1 Tax=Fraxinus pennsylvanica TaxID=56036 RepID=A0AAD2E000_9LAMI|nr:unnamed protein product [Fraxinus pennsylvanica]
MISDKQKEAAEELGVACFSWAEFASVGNLDGDLPPKQKTNTCMIIYTSGTRGKPKGVTLNNGAFIAEVLSMDKLLLEINKQGSEEDVYFSFLPLAHIFDQIIETYCVSQGSSIGFWEGDIRYLIKDLLVLKPTIFCGVPRELRQLTVTLSLIAIPPQPHHSQFKKIVKVANSRKLSHLFSEMICPFKD